MFRRVGQVMVVCALIFSIGAHWLILQSVAWTGMVIAYSQNATLKDALEKTFDGKHPCKLCRFVQDGKKSEKQQELQKPVTGIDFFLVSSAVRIYPPSAEPAQFAFFKSSTARGESPPIPPPRQLPG